MTINEFIAVIREERDLWLEERAEARQREHERDLCEELEDIAG